jgi:hypothetical protein
METEAEVDQEKIDNIVAGISTLTEAEAEVLAETLVDEAKIQRERGTIRVRLFGVFE